jgi:hypothetical protein
MQETSKNFKIKACDRAKEEFTKESSTNNLYSFMLHSPRFFLSTNYTNFS